MPPKSAWRFLADGVMGGLSTGGFTLGLEDGRPFARLTGRVSTANRGGFIQIRRPVETPPRDGETGVRLVVRGNGQRYFVHLRTKACVLPWQYYRSAFDAPGDWTVINLPFPGFHPSDARLPATLLPATVTSLAVVAAGRDHDAEVDVQDAGFA